jgi:hypothetical protein
VSQIQFYNGAILFVGGQIAMSEDCCCEEVPSEVPCTDCNVDPTELALVSVTPEPEPGSYCLLCEGFIGGAGMSFVPGEDACSWAWAHDNPNPVYYKRLYINYDVLTGIWSAEIVVKIQWWEDWRSIFSSADVEGVFCSPSTHQLYGTFVLPGVHEDCIGSEATVTLG